MHRSPANIESGGVNRYKRIKSKNGIVITMDDQQGQETLQVGNPGRTESHPSMMAPAPSPSRIPTATASNSKQQGSRSPQSAKVKVNASQVEVSAGMVKVDAAMSKFSGIVQCDTLISNAVISSSYTPGAGNIW